MSGSPRSQPPALPNFRHVGYLGGGGFADVFLYDQLRPVRQVALKVLREPAGDAAAQRKFDDEADLMARVSTHPYIVSVYGAEIAPDGRPFLVMEYYPRPHFGLRSREGPMAVAEVLKVGVRLASAVETAHRAGILHRDIKPANILVSQYGRPGLADFGIAGSTARDGRAESQGFSAAYAPREILLDEGPGDERSDVYSLAATLYTLLAGRSPFEIPGGDNSVNALMQRAIGAPLRLIERDDMPGSLPLLLAQALSRDPDQRPRTAADLGRSLQRVEAELGHTPTEFEVPDDTSSRVVRLRQSQADDEDGTRASRVQVVRQQGTAADATTDHGGAISSVPAPVSDQLSPVPPPRVVATSSSEALVDPTDTVARRRPGQGPPSIPVPTPEALEPNRRPIPVVLIASGLVLAFLVGFVVLVSRWGAADDGGGSSTSTVLVDDSALDIPETPPVPTDVAVEVNGGTASVVWDPGAGAEQEDTYLVVRTDVGGGEPVVVEDPMASIDVEAGATPCFEVSAQRGTRVSVEPSERGCAS